ncbi:hypothetical protein L6Q96_05000 [Candidatus Binatia bacterium]|nr:hypothetical protein [Candidatus Binatia bacterium]
MACHIPFAYNAKDGHLVRTIYPDAEIVRISSETASKVIPQLPRGMGVWMDPAVDGFERWPDVNDNWKKHIKTFAGWDSIGDKTFQQKPSLATVEQFVSEVLHGCLKAAQKASWLSVPQLPAVSDGSRNKINRVLADAAATWRAKEKYRGKLILPVILTHQEHADLKTDRNQRIKSARTFRDCSVARAMRVDWDRQ